MSADLPVPASIDSVDPADVAALELEAARARAELEDLAGRVVAAQAIADEAERGASEAPPAPATATAAVLAVVDGMLQTRLAELDAAIGTARREAAQAIASAIDEARAVLDAAGLDAAEVLGRTIQAPRSVRRLRRPPAASALWDDLVAGGAADGDQRSTADRGVVDLRHDLADAATSSDPGPSNPADVGPTAAHPSGLPADVAVAASPSGAGSPSAAVPDDPAKVYEMFWRGLPDERPVRERLRRRLPGEEAWPT